jgi:hypothetical protein
MYKAPLDDMQFLIDDVCQALDLETYRDLKAWR